MKIRNAAMVISLIFLIGFASTGICADTDDLDDGGFELGLDNTPWAGSWVDVEYTSPAFCTGSSTPNIINSSSLAHTGNYVAKFFAVEDFCNTNRPSSKISQTITIAPNIKFLNFWLKVTTDIGFQLENGEFQAVLMKQDNTEAVLKSYVKNQSQNDFVQFANWKEEESDISEYANGSSYTLIFRLNHITGIKTSGNDLLILLDDISLKMGSLILNPPEERTKETNYNFQINMAEIVKYDYTLKNEAGEIVKNTSGSNIEGTGITAEFLPFMLPGEGIADGLLTITVIGYDAGGNPVGDPTIISWTLDTIPPTAVITNPPSSTTQNIAGSVTIGGTDVTHYKYKLTSTAYSQEKPVSEQISWECLKSGDYTLSVIGKDAVGNWQTEENATTAKWKIAASPRASIVSGVPSSTTYNNWASITIGGTGITHYKYKLDEGSLSSERSVGFTIELRDLSVGSHKISVIGKDCGGNWQETLPTASSSWTVLEVKKGNIDASNNVVDLNDLILGLKILANVKTADPFLPATISGTRVELKDAIFILQVIAEKI